jgi:O-antigen/teichoic acid export membrane protein
MQAMTQYERPVLARAFKERDLAKVRGDVRNIHSILNYAVGFNVLGIALLIEYFPSMIGNGQYPRSTLWPILILLALGQLVRSQRTGSSAALQGAGQYRLLAFVTVKAAPVTLIGTVLAILFGWQTVASVLFAVLAGEVVTFWLINQLYRKMLNGEVNS